MLAVSLRARKLDKFLTDVHSLLSGRMDRAFSNFLKYVSKMIRQQYIYILTVNKLGLTPWNELWLVGIK